jgi:hypothetical protein
MSDTLLRALSDRIQGDNAGWSCSLQPDSRLPEHERRWWAIDPEFLTAYATRVRDEDMRHAQTQWAVKQHATRGNLLLGPVERGLWPILLPDGTTEFAFVVNFWNVQDLREEQSRIEFDDKRLHGHTRPRDANAGRWAGGHAHDEYGRKITGVADLL